MDLNLIRELAAARPSWQIVMLGPVAKISPEALPRARNIHYLGLKPYNELPAYFAGWKIGMLPFALNESTRFISPTKTPEYLAAGLKVISAPIRDVITPYGDLGLVSIANGASGFLRAADSLLHSPSGQESQSRVDKFLSQSSWDKTWSDMNQLIQTKLTSKLMPSSGRSPLSASATMAAKGSANV